MVKVVFSGLGNVADRFLPKNVTESATGRATGRATEHATGRTIERATGRATEDAMESQRSAVDCQNQDLQDSRMDRMMGICGRKASGFQTPPTGVLGCGF